MRSVYSFAPSPIYWYEYACIARVLTRRSLLILDCESDCRNTMMNASWLPIDRPGSRIWAFMRNREWECTLETPTFSRGAHSLPMWLACDLARSRFRWSSEIFPERVPFPVVRRSEVRRIYAHECADHESIRHTSTCGYGRQVVCQEPGNFCIARQSMRENALT